MAKDGKDPTQLGSRAASLVEVGSDVLIIGAGPVGLSAALAVRATGRPVKVVEAGSANRLRPGSRAIFIHKVTLEVLERICPGLGHDLASRALIWRTKRTFYRGRQVYHRTYPASVPGALPAAANLPQVLTEQILYDACVDAGVEFAWDSAVSRATGSADGVRLDLSDGSTLDAGYAIGADGSRSAVRETAGLQLEGPRTSNAFVIVDTAEDPTDPLPRERVFHYEHPGAGCRNVLLVPFAGHWRVDLQCRLDDDADALSSSEGIRGWLPRVMPAKYADRVTWVSTYVFRQAVANRFADASRRILLAGEAGHVFAPFGARGLNSGIADAFVAAGAIDRALKARSAADAATAIDDFEQARRAAALRNRAASSTAFEHLVASSLTTRVTRRVAGALAPSMPSVGRWMDSAAYGPVLQEPDRHGMHY